MKNWFCILSIGFLVVVFFKTESFAHPHVFINQKIKIVFDAKGVAGFRIQWEFDDMFTTMIAGDYDINKNQLLEKNEVTTIKEKAFSYLANSNYFTFIKIDNVPFNVKFVQHFSATIINKKLIYDFFIPCHVSASFNTKRIIVATYDPTYYSAISFAEHHGAVLDEVKGDIERFETEVMIQEDKSTKIYFDMICPTALFLEFRLAK